MINDKLQITKLVVFLFIIWHSLFIIPAAKAADSTPSADIKSKLEELKKEIASRAAKLKQEVNKKLQNKAYIGKVKNKSATSITLAAETGPKIVSTNQDTVYENKQSLPSLDGKLKAKQKFSQKTLIEEDYIAALGDVDETGVLIAKKIILLSNPPEPKTFLWGQVVSISDKLATLKDKTAKNIAFIFPQTTIKLNDYVILTGRVNKEIFDVEFVYVIPQGKIIKPKVASPSATPKTEKIATKSASPEQSSRP